MKKKNSDSITPPIHIISDLIKRVIDSWKLDAKELTDEYLNEDRSQWMKIYGRDDSELGDDKTIDVKDGDIYTIAIELEQIRRYGKIVYDDKEKLKVDMIWDGKNKTKHWGKKNG